MSASPGADTATLSGSGPFTFVAAAALTMKIGEAGQVINAVSLVATGVNGDGRSDILGFHVAGEPRQR